MLSKYGMENIEVLKKAVYDVWGKEASIVDTKIINRPFDMFEMYLILHKKYHILLSYDRSIVDIAVLVEGKYKWLTDITNMQVVEGFNSCKTENLAYNFQVLEKAITTL
jgi:hypothetical protein